jgi:hypothetical protein
MTKHPLRATFERFDEPMSADFRDTLRARLLADLARVDANAGAPQQLDDATTDVDDTQEVTVLKKIDRSSRPQSRSQALVAVAAVTIIAVGVAALVINKRNADEPRATNASSASVSPGPATTVATTVPSSPGATAADRNAYIQGLWTTGLVPVDQITQAMLQAGVTQDLVDGWLLEVGASTEHTYDLEFSGDKFRHFAATPGITRQVDESGTFTYTPANLVLNIVDQGTTYTFTAVVACCDSLRLHFVDSTANGTAVDKANLARVIAAYASAPFQRHP